MPRCVSIVGCALVGVVTSVLAEDKTASSPKCLFCQSATFDFNENANGPVGGNQLTITHFGIMLTAYGFNADNSPHQLYWKDKGADEQGLGLVDTLDKELTLQANGSQIANYIQLDLSAIYRQVSSARLIMSSVTHGEKFDLYGSNTKGLIGTRILYGSTLDQRLFNIPDWGQYSFVSVAVTPQGSCHREDNVLLEGIFLPCIPEPSTEALVCCGLCLVIFIGKTRCCRYS